jgi:hypothetical protein
MGLTATLYQQIFNDPDTIYLNFAIWFTGIVGGVWLLIFPSLGLVGIRLLGIIVFTLMVIMVFNLLKNNFDQKKLKLGIGLLTILIGPFFVFIGFHYNTISALLLVTVIYFLFNGLISKNNFFLIVAGFVLCLNTSARIPNITGIALLLPALYYGYKNSYTFHQYFKLIIFFLSGFFIGLAFVFFMMKLLKHDEFYLSAITDTLNRGKSGNSHNIFSLLKLYFNQYGEIVIMILTGTLLVSIYALAANKVRYKILFVFPFLVAFALYEQMLQNDFMRVKELFIYHGFAFLFSFICLADEKLNSDQKFLALLGIFMMMLMPLGSNYGFINSNGLSFVISLPVAFCCFLSVKPFSIKVFKGVVVAVNQITLSVISITLVSIMVITALFSSIYYSYCEASKHKLIYSINSKQAKGIFTSKERAQALNELLAESSKYLKKDDYALAYHTIPMFYFLSETRPWLYNIWTSTYSVQDLDYFIKRSYSEKNVLPVIIKAKFSTWGNWPKEGIINDALPKSELDNYLDKKLIEDNNYKLVWESKSFQILVPPEKTETQ